jgi:hypothetical protein
VTVIIIPVFLFPRVGNHPFFLKLFGEVVARKMIQGRFMRFEKSGGPEIFARGKRGQRSKEIEVTVLFVLVPNKIYFLEGKNNKTC